MARRGLMRLLSSVAGKRRADTRAFRQPRAHTHTHPRPGPYHLANPMECWTLAPSTVRQGLGMAHMGAPRPPSAAAWLGRKLTVRSQVKIARNGHSLELLLPADLKGTAPVRAFFDVVGEELVRERKMPLVFRMGNPGRMIRLTKGFVLGRAFVRNA
jgi:hypothetical protein